MTPDYTWPVVLILLGLLMAWIALTSCVSVDELEQCRTERRKYLNMYLYESMQRKCEVK
jgi:hypothetical protein